MVSEIDRTKRVLVSLLKRLAAKYDVTLVLTRDSADADVRAAVKKVSRKAHPDKRGSTTDQTDLNNARDAWQDAAKKKVPEAKAAGQSANGTGDARGSGNAAAAGHVAAAVPKRRDPGFRVMSTGVSLTYQKFTDLGVWMQFLAFVEKLLQTREVKNWSATLETNADETYHLHLMLQFYRAKDRAVQDFAFRGVCPNARSNDLLGEGCP
jgi:hypothetical protein